MRKSFLSPGTGENRRPLTFGLLVLVGGLTVCPVVLLLLGSLTEGLGAFGRLTLAKYRAAYADPGFAAILYNTFVFTVGSATVCTALAFFLAYLNTRTNLPGKVLFRILSVVPMMIPHILFCVSWVLLLNPSNGLLNLLLREALGLSASPFNIYTLPGMILVEALLDLPIAYLVLAPALSAFDATLEESSHVCGASRWHTFFRVTLPVLRPAVLAAFILVIVRSLASFAVPSVIGIPGRIYVLASHIYRLVATGFSPDYGQAAAVGTSALAASIVLVVLYRRLTASSERFVTVSGRGYRPAIIELKRAKIPLLAVVGLLCFVWIVLPVLVLGYVSLLPYSMIPGEKAFALMSLKNWRLVLADPISRLSLRNSLLLGIGGAVLGMVLSFFVSWVIVRVRSTAAGILESLSFLSFSFPGIVIGVGFLWFFVLTPLYGTLWALLIGYIATYLPYGIRPLTSALVQIHSHLEESSRVCGAGPLTTLRRIVFPLLVPGIVSGWILMATMFVRELSLSVVLSRPGTEVLAVQILRFSEDGLWGRLAALGIVMILISTALVVIAGLFGRRSLRAFGLEAS